MLFHAFGFEQIVFLTIILLCVPVSRRILSPGQFYFETEIKLTVFSCRKKCLKYKLFMVLFIKHLQYNLPRSVDNPFLHYVLFSAQLLFLFSFSNLTCLATEC